jgi:hypothetical protein
VNIFLTVIDALNRSGARYVVVGGFAVNLQGYQRFTSDLDVQIDLAPRAGRSAVESIWNLGFRPRVPVVVEDFSDENMRRKWRSPIVIRTEWIFPI